jgi:hypothetical protein
LKPQLCSWCQADQPGCFCDQWPFTCRKQLALFLSGYEAARQEAFRKGFDTAIEETAVDPATLDTIPVAGLEKPTVRCPEGEV